MMVRDRTYSTSSSCYGNGDDDDDDDDDQEEEEEEELMINNNTHNDENDDDDDISNSRRRRRGRKLPAWLGGLMGETFFGGCGVHQNLRKNEKNIFCLLCCLSICPHCLPSHPSHPLLQVRRYVYHDVIRLGDLEKLIDCSYIQPYTINSAKVIFLNQRPQSRPCKGSANICLTCDRILQEPFHFCSLSCKVDHMVDKGEDLSTILYRIDESDLAFSQFEGLRMDSSEIIDDDAQINPILEDPMLQHYRGSSCSNETAMGNCGISQVPDMMTHSSSSSKKKKKKKGNGFLPGMVLSLSSRRKGAPHRAPLS